MLLICLMYHHTSGIFSIICWTCITVTANKYRRTSLLLNSIRVNLFMTPKRQRQHFALKCIDISTDARPGARICNDVLHPSCDCNSNTLNTHTQILLLPDRKIDHFLLSRLRFLDKIQLSEQRKENLNRQM